MSTEIIEKILECAKLREKVLSRIVQKNKMVKGSFCEIFVKCGKKYCHCNSGPGHSHKRMSLRENGKAFSRAVPRGDYEWIEEMTENYREYRSMRRQLTQLDAEIQMLLNEYESYIVEHCKGKKSYLNVSNSEAKPNKASETTQKERRRK